MHTIHLPSDQAVVLQQIEETGGEDFNNLVETLQMNRPRMAHIIQSLQHKGLISLQGNGDRGFWVRVSRKGERLVHYIWPESAPKLQASY